MLSNSSPLTLSALISVPTRSHLSKPTSTSPTFSPTISPTQSPKCGVGMMRHTGTYPTVVGSMLRPAGVSYWQVRLILVRSSRQMLSLCTLPRPPGISPRQLRTRRLAIPCRRLFRNRRARCLLRCSCLLRLGRNIWMRLTTMISTSGTHRRLLLTWRSHVLRMNRRETINLHRNPTAIPCRPQTASDSSRLQPPRTRNHKYLLLALRTHKVLRTCRTTLPFSNPV
jgi:hypothetical protein